MLDLACIETGFVQSSNVLKRFGHVLLIVAVLAATGTHWLVLQSVAWTSMLTDNLRTTSLVQAIERTFDGRHPCSLCKQIAKGKQSETKSDFRAEWKKLEFVSQRPVFVFTAPSFGWEMRAPDDFAAVLTHSPPVPPPKSLRG